MIERRGFIELFGGSVASLVGIKGLEQQDGLVGVDKPVKSTGVLIGRLEDRPEPGSEYFQKFKTGPTLLYITIGDNEGQMFTIDGKDDEWNELLEHLPVFSPGSFPREQDEDGYLIFDGDRGVIAWWDGDEYMHPNFVNDVLISPVTVENTTNPITVFQPIINAGSLIEGRKYRLLLHGTFGTFNNSNQFTVDVQLEGETIAELQSKQELADLGTPWNMTLPFTVFSDGETGELKPNSWGMFNEQIRTISHDRVTVNTLTSTDFSVNIVWDEANPENSVTVEQASLEQMA